MSQLPDFSPHSIQITGHTCDKCGGCLSVQPFNQVLLPLRLNNQQPLTPPPTPAFFTIADTIQQQLNTGIFKANMDGDCSGITPEDSSHSTYHKALQLYIYFPLPIFPCKQQREHLINEKDW